MCCNSHRALGADHQGVKIHDNGRISRPLTNVDLLTNADRVAGYSGIVYQR